MKKIVIASSRISAGKTSILAGLGAVLGRKLGYMKPFGDRLLYKKKRLWDYDAALMTDLFGLTESPEDITIGFEHAKLKFMFNGQAVKEKLSEISDRTGIGKNVLFIEGGMDLSCGSSVYLDPICIAEALSAKLVVVASGNDGAIEDDIAFIKNRIKKDKVKFGGIIINKVKDVEEFKQTCMKGIAKHELPILGVIPYTKELTSLTIGFLADSLFTKVLTGHESFGNVVENIFVGAMSAETALNNALFKKQNKLIITSGDRSDMIITAIETNSAGIILTNSFVPAPHIISKAMERKIPLLSVAMDTYQAAKQIDNIEPLLMKGETDKKDILARLVKENINLKELS